MIVKNLGMNILKLFCERPRVTIELTRPLRSAGIKADAYFWKVTIHPTSGNPSALFAM
jgi:hypothetical protein